MATTPSPMASQLKSSFSSSLARRPAIPTAISGAPFRVSPSKRSFTVKAIQSEKPTYQVVQPIKWRSLHRKPRDSRHIKPADCMVPVKSARLQDSSEPASPRNRGWTCPWLPPGGLVAILSICLTMYGVASFTEGEPSTAPGLTLTGRKKVPDQLQTSEGWAKFSGGFFFGGISGVIWAYFLLYVINLPYYFK
ncbi:hypothetical protein OIU76_008366 [Salix suchowensis]|nr:hypothetical protein OIU76_008366 [Salix suchowensis]